MQAYTYSVKHLPSNRYYYGVRKSSYFDLFEEYFTSSKIVKKLIETDGLESFKIKMRKKFETYEEARTYELKVLKRLNVTKNPNMLNISICSPIYDNTDTIIETIRKEKIRKTMIEKYQNDEYRTEHLSKSLGKTKKQRSEIALMGAVARAEKYKTGELKYKIKKPKKYKEVNVYKGGRIKTIKSNQVPAYMKCGWTKSL